MEFSNINEIKDDYLQPVILGDTKAYARIEPRSKMLMTIDIGHAKIHLQENYAGSHYFESVATNGVACLHIKISSVKAHFTFECASSKNGVLRFYENPTLSNDGTLVPTYNSDRSSTYKALSSVYHTPTITNAGTQLYIESIGGDGVSQNSPVTGRSKHDREFILNTNTSYLIHYTSLSDTNRVSLSMNAYGEYYE